MSVLLAPPPELLGTQSATQHQKGLMLGDMTITITTPDYTRPSHSHLYQIEVNHHNFTNWRDCWARNKPIGCETGINLVSVVWSKESPMTCHDILLLRWERWEPENCFRPTASLAASARYDDSCVKRPRDAEGKVFSTIWIYLWPQETQCSSLMGREPYSHKTSQEVVQRDHSMHLWHEWEPTK